MSKEIKNMIYYHMRRAQFDELLKLCDKQLSNKGKDPVLMFWRAFAVGMIGDPHEAIRQLDSPAFQSRKDLHLPVTLALLQMHKVMKHPDEEAIDSLAAEASIAEDVAKDTGLALAARFAVLTGDYEIASRLSDRVCESGSARSIQSLHQATPLEAEAVSVSLWSTFLTHTQSTTKNIAGIRAVLRRVEDFTSAAFSSGDSLESRIDTIPDMCLLAAQCRVALDDAAGAVDTLSKSTGLYPSFTPALTDKLLAQLQLLVTDNDWEPVLDTAQRLIDCDPNHVDALLVLSLHALTQDGTPGEGQAALEDLDRALLATCPSSRTAHVSVAVCVSGACCRDSTALQLCAEWVARCIGIGTELGIVNGAGNDFSSQSHSKANVDAKLLVELGRVRLLQGRLEEAAKAFKDASAQDDSHGVGLASLLGQVQVQVMSGEVADAEAQLELFEAMRDGDSEGGEGDELLSTELLIRAQLARLTQGPGPEHLKHLDAYLSRTGLTHGSVLTCHMVDPSLRPLVQISPEPKLALAMEYLTHLPDSANPSTTSAFLQPPPVETVAVAASPGPSTATMRGMGMTRLGWAGTMHTLSGPLVAPGLTVGTAMNTNLTTPRLAPNGSPIATVAATIVDTSVSEVEISPAVAAGLALLREVLQSSPGVPAGYTEAARALGRLGRLSEATRTLQQCLSLHPRLSPALVLQATVELSRSLQTGPQQQKAAIAAAVRCLDQAIAVDFNVRSDPLYRLTRAQVSTAQGLYDEAIAEFQQIVQLPAVRHGSGTYLEPAHSNYVIGADVGAAYAIPLRLTDSDRLGVYTLLGHLYGRGKRLKEAKEVFEDARAVFRGKPSLEAQLLLASAQFSADRRDFETALRLLDQVPVSTPARMQAQHAKAELLLTQLRDRDGYIKVYQQLAAAAGGPAEDPTGELGPGGVQAQVQTRAALGEACLRVGRPAEAVKAFEAADALGQGNFKLKARIGRILVSTHEYFRAVEHYESAIREAQQTSIGGVGAGADAGEVVALSHDLARLLLRLGRVEACGRVLQRALRLTGSGYGLGERGKEVDIEDMRLDVSTLLLQAELSQMQVRGLNAGDARGERIAVIESLRRALDMQRRVVAKARETALLGTVVEGSTGGEREVLAEICARLGAALLPEALAVCRSSRTSDKEKDSGGEDVMVECLKLLAEAETLSRSGTSVSGSGPVSHPHLGALMASARLFSAMGEHPKAVVACRKILSDEPAHAEAAILLSETLFRTQTQEHTDDSSQAAMAPLVTLLALNPCQYTVLARLLSLLRRSGSSLPQSAPLEEADKYLAAAMAADPRSQSRAGYMYCEALLAKLRFDVVKAIRSFNRVRRDTEFGPSALAHMVELYLNPDQQLPSELTGGTGKGGHGGQGLPDETVSEQLAVAQALVDELRERVAKNTATSSSDAVGMVSFDPRRVEVLQAQCYLASRQRTQLDRALQTMQRLLDKDANYIPAGYMLAVAYLHQNEQHKARNLLKRLCAASGETAGNGAVSTQQSVGQQGAITSGDSEDYVNACLLLAKLHIDQSKGALAKELCERCLSLNRGSVQAWEMLGVAAEREEDWTAAADCFRRAWSLGGRNIAPTGFKLAFCCLRARRATEAVDICEEVLDRFPEYPRIREDVLLKALQTLQ